MGRRPGTGSTDDTVTAAQAGLVLGVDGARRCGWCTGSEDYVAYHDHEWGRPVVDDVRIYEKLCLEGFQSGLSWLTILRKRENFRAAFDDFDPEVVARYGPSDVDRLLADGGIVRHRGKVEAAIANARATLRSRREHGSLAALVWSFEPRRHGRRVPTDLSDIASRTEASEALAEALKHLGFRFIGPTTAYAAMQSLGLVDDHLDGCWAREACEADRVATPIPAST